MQSRNTWVTIGIVLIVSAAVLLALAAWTDFSSGAATFVFILIVLGIGIGLFINWFKENAYILVDEMDTAVIFHKKIDKFAYFIDSELDETANDMKGRPYNLHNQRALNKWRHRTDKYHHFINPFTETVFARITKKSQGTSGTLEDLRTREGVPVKISYKVGFKVIISQINPGLEFKMARALPFAAPNMVKGRTEHVLRYLIEQKSVTELYGPEAIRNLEDEMREEVSARSAALGVDKLGINDMKLGPIIMPYEVQKAIEAAHERELHTATTVKALEQIKRAINEYDDNDIERLAELERLRILDHHGGGLSYEMSNLRKTIEKNKTKRVVRENKN